MAKQEHDTSRLTRAIRLGVSFREAGRADVDGFLAEHPDLADLLEPILRPPVADASADPAPASGPPREPGGYRLERELGRGGMGAVYLARQTAVGRRVALKVLSGLALRVSEPALLRFEREARILASLEHPGIVRVLDAQVHDGLPFFVMELVHGASLADVLPVLRRGGLASTTGATLRAAVVGHVATIAAEEEDRADAPSATAWQLPADYVDAAVTIAAAIAEALGHAHGHGVVHRDVKPGNILLRTDGRAVVADFGVARRDTDATLTATGQFVGSPLHMAPEQVRGEPADARTDVFALGACLYELLTLRSPFEGASPAETIANVLREDPPDPSRLNPRIGRDLAAVLGMSLAKVPAHRYESAQAMAADLQAVLARRPVRARRPGRLQRLWRSAVRRPWRAVASLAASVAVVATITVDQIQTARVRAETMRRQAAIEAIERLSVGARIDRAEQAAQAFATARFEDLAAIERWEEEHGVPLAADLPVFERLLTEIRVEALPYGPDEVRRDREGHPEAETLTRLEAMIEGWRQPSRNTLEADREAELARLNELRDRLRERVAVRRTWQFVDQDRQFLHDELASVVERLRAFVAERGTAARLARTKTYVTGMQRRTVVEAADRWREVAADLALDPRFQGLHLRPQFGLLPIGKDPASGLWEFVHLGSGQAGSEVPQRGADGRLAPRAADGIVLVLLPGGKVLRGAQPHQAQDAHYDPAARSGERPVHEVSLDPFFCGKYEVTWQQALRISARSIARASKGAANDVPMPANTVSHQDARRFLVARGLDLPTDAQWEYACRSGTSTPYHFGAVENAPRHANFADRSAGFENGGFDDYDDGHAEDAPVGSFAPNAFGLHDMHGNVAELVADRQAHYVTPPRAGDGAGVALFDEDRVSCRGGSFRMRLQRLRSSARERAQSRDSVATDVGWRVVRRVDR